MIRNIGLFAAVSAILATVVFFAPKSFAAHTTTESIVDLSAAIASNNKPEQPKALSPWDDKGAAHTHTAKKKTYKKAAKKPIKKKAFVAAPVVAETTATATATPAVTVTATATPEKK